MPAGQAGTWSVGDETMLQISRTRSRQTPVLLLLALAVLCPLAAGAADVSGEATRPALERDQVEAERAALEARIKDVEGAEIEEEVRQRQLAPLLQLRQVLADTLTHLDAIERHRARASQSRQEREGAAARLEALKAGSAVPAVPAEPQVPPDASLAQLEQAAAQVDADLAAAGRALADVDAQLQRRTDRRKLVPDRIAEVSGQLEDVNGQLAAPAPAEEPADLTAARIRSLGARGQALESELEALAEEIPSYDATREIVLTQRDRAAQRVAALERLSNAWNEIVNERRIRDAATEAARARREAARALPPLRALAEENERLARERTDPEGAAAGISRVLGLSERIDRQAQDLREELDGIKERVQLAGGFTRGIGLLLLRKRDELADLGRLRRDIRRHQEEMSRIALARVDIAEQRRADPESVFAGVMAGLDPGLSEADREVIETQARQLLQTRREYLDALTGDHDAYFARLGELLKSERALLGVSELYQRYIDEHILWVQSAPSLGGTTLPHAVQAVRGFLAPAGWAAVGGALLADVRRHPVTVGFAVLILIAFLLSRRPLRRRLVALGEAVQGAQRTRFAPTLRALLVSLLLAARWPALLLFLSWRLAADAGLPEFVYAVSYGLRSAALMLLVAASARALCQKGGLADRHFRMRTEARQVLFRHLSWFAAAAPSLAFVFFALQRQGNEVWAQSLGRLAFMLGLLALSALSILLLRPGGQVMQAALARRRGGWLDRLRTIWLIVGAGVPLAIAALAGFGYYYSAQQLQRRLHGSILLLLGTLLVGGLLSRWLLVVRMRLVLKRVQQERQKEADSTGPAAESARDGSVPVAREEEEESVYSLGLQTMQLLRFLVTFALVVGLWLVWADVLPALNVLKGAVLWNTEVAGETVPITLGSVAFAALAVLLTVIASKNLPALLEIAILQNLRMDRGVRFAVTSLTRYTISIIGVVVAFGAIGIGWAKVQWLIAAMTFGLGFGLQEIFANFVSGLVIIFERPMRVGDTVTVGDTTGTVTRIRIRATTILDWDRREMIVPNKEFITGRLVNWTLSDTTHRLHFPVGIAHGSDTRLAEQTLLRLAREDPDVMEDPAPAVVFRGFVDSALDFELRLFIPSMEVYGAVWHRMNMAIDDAFRKEGIEIAFPQHDVHIRSVDVPFPVDMAHPPEREDQ